MKDKSKTPGKNPRRPTISDVARTAGVAPSTVSHALNNKGYVEEKTRERILDAVEMLGYRPNARARSLRTGGVKTIALVSTMPLGVAGGTSKLGFLMELAAVAAEEAVKRGLALLLIPPQPKGSELPGLEVDGSIMVEPTAHDPHLEWLHRANYPVVCLGRWHGHDAVPCVDLLSGYTAEIVLKHLKESGAKRIALMIGDTGRHSYVATAESYRKFCRQEKTEPVVLELDEDGGELAGQIAATELFRSRPDIDGIYAHVDAFAAGVVQAGQLLGVDIPGRVKLATRYDSLRAKLSPVPITAVDLHLDEVAAMGVDLLCQVINNEEPPASLQVRKPVLVPRLSSSIRTC